VKVKQSYPATLLADAKGDRRYSSYLFLTSTLGGVSGQLHALTALYSREELPVPIGREAGRASELVWIHVMKTKIIKFLVIL
jgi:hypothetical protein